MPRAAGLAGATPPVQAGLYIPNSGKQGLPAFGVCPAARAPGTVLEAKPGTLQAQAAEGSALGPLPVAPRAERWRAGFCACQTIALCISPIAVKHTC